MKKNQWKPATENPKKHQYKYKNIILILGTKESVKLLIEKGAYTYSRQIDGLTPLHIACRDGIFECFALEK